MSLAAGGLGKRVRIIRPAYDGTWFYDVRPRDGMGTGNVGSWVIPYDVRLVARIARLIPIFHSLFANRECRMTRIGSTFVPLQRVYVYTMMTS